MSQIDRARADLLAQYTAACDYNTCRVDEVSVERALRVYLAALRLKRTVVRLKAGWQLCDYPALARYVDGVLDEFASRTSHLVARDALVALAAQVARVAQDALVAQAALDALAARDALDARAALDARDARDALAALDALAARAARDAQAALDARDARAARDALDAQAALAARDALDARAARDALDALAALDARAARAARDARDALAARDAQAALAARAATMHRFAAWCLQANGWLWWRWELSWISTVYLGAVQLRKPVVLAWSKPLFDAFVAGAWLLHWTDDTLYWVSKPSVHCESVGGQRRLHCPDGPALESDIEPLYFWHGVLVSEAVVLRPETITVAEIQQETNAEVRRVLLDRYGYDRYLTDSGALPIHADYCGTLYRCELGDDEPLVMVSVRNSTPEPDGSQKTYMLRVPPTITTARAAVAWTFDVAETAYKPAVET